MQSIDSDIALSFKNNGAVLASNVMVILNSDSRLRLCQMNS